MDVLLIVVLLLFMAVAALAYKIGSVAGSLQRDRHWEEQIPGIKKDSVERSRASLGGQFSEQLAPYLPNFKYKPTECKFLGKPVDLLVFEGLDEKEVTEIVFVEVKSGGAELNTVQRKIRDAVKAGRVRWDEYRIPKELTMRKEE
ncbi:MAG TPA: Holliday junction resolvase-like protein [Candidatus Nanoarchaeia archaeon]|nr:Holliday junction resolvase-like protein [Candidatus Nanoarchaeia archaeon]